MPCKRWAPEITTELRRQSILVVFATAKEYDIPPVHITAHVRCVKADAARKQVMRLMLTELGMARYQVAEAFDRSVRRVRKSVLGV